MLRNNQDLEKKKIEKARIILEKIGEPECLSIVETRKILFRESEKNQFLPLILLYNLQQTKPRLTIEYYKVLNYLDHNSQLNCNTYAKQFLALSTIEELHLLEDESDKRKSASEVAEASLGNEGRFEDAKDELQTSSSWTKYFFSR